MGGRQERAPEGSCPGPGALAEGPVIWEAGTHAHLLSGSLGRCSLNCTVIVCLDLPTSFLGITLQVPETEPYAKKLRKAIGPSVAAVVPSGGSEIFYNQMSKTSFSHATRTVPPSQHVPPSFPRSSLSLKRWRSLFPGGKMLCPGFRSRLAGRPWAACSVLSSLALVLSAVT